jgi:hypothetical protein
MQSKTEFPISVGKVTIELQKGVYVRLCWTIDGKKNGIGFGRNEGDNLKVMNSEIMMTKSDFLTTHL